MEKRLSKRILENKKRKYDDSLLLAVDQRSVKQVEDIETNDLYEPNINKFLYILHSICMDVNNLHIVEFYDKGGFVIKDVELFKKIIIQKYRLNDYMSFVRNLNNYGFVNITPRHKYDKRFFTKDDLFKLNGNELIYANPYFLNNYEELKKLNNIKFENVHLNKNTFHEKIKELHSNETNNAVSILLSIKNDKNF